MFEERLCKSTAFFYFSADIFLEITLKNSTSSSRFLT